MKIDEIDKNRVLNNEATTEEARGLATWFGTDEGQAYLSHRLDEESVTLTEEEVDKWVSHDIPEQKMRHRFLEQIKPQQRTKSRWWVAAVLIPFLLLGGSMLFFADRIGLFSEVEYAEFIVPAGEQLRVVLQDGTTVQLNSDTRLKYPKQFGMFNRTVELEGEAYFDVAKEKKRPFIVDLKEISVKVTGTKFNVKAYALDSEVWVSLDEGGVLLQDQKGREYPLLPGESAEYNRLTGICEITYMENQEQINSWRTQSLNFYLTPLKEILKVLERQYDARFIVNDSSLLNSRFTLSSSKVSVQEVLEDLAAVSHISFLKTESGAFELIRSN